MSPREDTRLAEWTREATKLGRETGLAAASWIIDGNNSDSHYARLEKLMDDGDPALDDLLPARPNLSGEWADDLTPIRLYELVTGRDHADAEADAGMGYETLVGWIVDALADAWESGVDDTFHDECERLVKEALS